MSEPTDNDAIREMNLDDEDAHSEMWNQSTPEPEVLCDGNSECFRTAEKLADLLRELKALRDELDRTAHEETDGTTSAAAYQAGVGLGLAQLDALIRRYEGDRV